MTTIARKGHFLRQGGSRVLIVPSHLPRTATNEMVLAATDDLLLVDATGKRSEEELLEVLQAVAAGLDPKSTENTSPAVRTTGNRTVREELDAYEGQAIGQLGIHYRLDELGNVIRLKPAGK